jgi:hypothetical protein
MNKLLKYGNMNVLAGVLFSTPRPTSCSTCCGSTTRRTETTDQRQSFSSDWQSDTGNIKFKL